MQIPELCSLFGTQYALLVRFQSSSREPCKKKLALTFLLGGLDGEFGNGVFWAHFMIYFLHNDRHIQYGDKCSVLPWAGANGIKESGIRYYRVLINQMRGFVYMFIVPLLPLHKTYLSPPTPLPTGWSLTGFPRRWPVPMKNDMHPW